MLPHRVFAAAWLVIAVALLGSLGFWAATVATSLGVQKPIATVPSPAPVPIVSTVITVYPNTSAVNQNALCALVVPRYNSVIVDSISGAVIANIRC